MFLMFSGWLGKLLICRGGWSDDFLDYHATWGGSISVIPTHVYTHCACNVCMCMCVCVCACVRACVHIRQILNIRG